MHKLFLLLVGIIFFQLNPALAVDEDIKQCRANPQNCFLTTCGEFEWICWHNGNSINTIVGCSHADTPQTKHGTNPCKSPTSRACGEIQGQRVRIGDFGSSVYILDSSDNVLHQTPILETLKVKTTPGTILTSGESGSFSLRCDNDVSRGLNNVTVRHGHNLDLFWFLGVNGNSIVPHFARLMDGEHLGVVHRSQGPLIILGRKKDIYIQYCFDGSLWTSTDVIRTGLPPEDVKCDRPALSTMPKPKEYDGPVISPCAGKLNYKLECDVETVD